jgi:copper transport protein
VALAAGGRAAAHAQLVAADPTAGTVVAAMPPEVTLRFNEPVAPLVIRWLPPQGAPQDLDAAADGPVLVVPVPAGLGEGTHVLSWRVVSSDGHPIGGSYVFSVGAPSETAGTGGAGATAAPAAAARGLLTLAMVAGVGGAVFLRGVARATPAPPGPAGLAVTAALMIPPLALLAFGLHGLDLLGAAPAELATVAPWDAALASAFAATVGLAALAGLLAAGALLAPRGGTGLALLAWTAASVSFALSGHAATAPPVWLTAPAVALHAAAFLFWLGALPGIAAFALAGGPGLGPLLHRFSRQATPLVALLALGGTALALVQLGGPEPRLDTAYGRLLALKLAAVALLLGLAALNRFRLTPAIDRGDPAAPARLRRSVRAEIALGLMILALAAGFRLTPPPRAVEALPVERYLHLHGPRAMADIVLRPGRPGPNTVEITVMDGDFQPLAPLELAIAFSDPARGIEPIVVPAAPDGGIWRAGPVQLPFGGAWEVTLDALISDFEKALIEGPLTLDE